MKLHRPLHSAALLLAISLLPAHSAAQWTAPNPVVDSQKQTDGVLIHLRTGTLRLQVCSPSIIHLIYSPTTGFPEHPNPVIVKTSWPQTGFQLAETPDLHTLYNSRV